MQVSQSSTANLQSFTQQIAQTLAADSALWEQILEDVFSVDLGGQQAQTLQAQWATSDFSALPPIVLLPATSMPGAAGAYARSTDTIYLNQDWLTTATETQVMAVVAEEFGHHLDALLNPADTPGDEGKLFAAQVLGIELSAEQRAALADRHDHGVILVEGSPIAVEFSSLEFETIPAGIGQGSSINEGYNPGAVAFLKADGSVLTFNSVSIDNSYNRKWSLGEYSSSKLSDLNSGVIQLYSNRNAFVARKSDGSIVTWADNSRFEGKPYASVADSSPIFSNSGGFMALQSDGTPVTWGDSLFTGKSYYSRSNKPFAQVVSNTGAFAALATDGSVHTFGRRLSGGDKSVVDYKEDSLNDVWDHLNSGVVQVVASSNAFAALKSDGLVVTWGRDTSGGDSSSVATQLSSGVTEIFSMSNGFAALKSDGTFVTWGLVPDSSGVADQLSSGITQILDNRQMSTSRAIAALKSDGSVVTWGNSQEGGSQWPMTNQLTSEVVELFASRGAFTALKSDGSVVSWGRFNSSSVADQLSSGVVRVITRDGAVAALKSDGSVVAWGLETFDNDIMTNQLGSDVVHIFNIPVGFAALKSDGSVIGWSHDSSFLLATDVIDVADPLAKPALFNPTPPTDILISSTDVEESAQGAVVGTLTTIDPDVDDVHTYTVDDPRFEVVNGQLKLKPESSLDFESESTVTVNINTTEVKPWPPAWANLKLGITKSFTLSVLDNPNEAPTLLGSPQRIKDIALESSSAYPSYLTRLNNTLFFVADDGQKGTELWRSNGSRGDTALVKDIASGQVAANPNQLTVVGNTLFFTADDGNGEIALWKSSGTEDSTAIVKTIPADGFNLSNLIDLNGTLFFTLNDGMNGTELWQSDGTEAGTVMVTDIRAGGSAFPSQLVAIGNTLYFTADDGSAGRELWKSDGTAAGTVMVKDIAPGAAGSFPYELTNLDGVLYFTADDGEQGVELWRSDGTAIGTIQVKDIFAGSIGSNPANLTIVGNLLYFTASDDTHGSELWKSDGTVAGTVLVKDIAPGSAAASVFNLTHVNGKLFFTANDGVNGEELWVSDGTEAGTVMVQDIAPGAAGSNPSNLKDINGTLYFSADDEVYGRELWKSDGTAAGTIQIADISSSGSSANPDNLTDVNGTTYFTATDNTTGVELYRLSAGLADQIMLKGTTLTMPFAVNDQESDATTLTVKATSSDLGLIADSDIQTIGSGRDRILSLTPQAGQTGEATITVEISDGVNTTQIPFNVTVASTLISLEAARIEEFESTPGFANYRDSTPYNFTLTRTGDLSSSSTVNYAVTGSGLNPADADDFGGTLPTGTVTFAPGEATQTITVVASGDSLSEADEDFTLTISNSTNGVISSATASGAILDDEPSPTLAIAPTNLIKDEGDVGKTPFSFTITRTGNLRQTSTVDYNVVSSGVHAATAADFFGGTLPSGTVTFAPGESEKTLTIDVLAEAELEQDETFEVLLSNPIGAGTTITTSRANATIFDDDYPRISLSISRSAKDLNEKDSEVAILTATSDRVFEEDITIDLGLFSGRAQKDSDYSVSNTLVIPAGQTIATTELRINNDELIEGTESFSTEIVSLVNALTAESKVQRVEGKIIDDDYPEVSIELISDMVVEEDDQSGLSFRVTRSVATHEPLTVNLSLGGTATPYSDYTPPPRRSVYFPHTVEIPAGQTSTVFTLFTADSLAESDEIIEISIDGDVFGSYYELAEKSTASATIRNDDIVNIRVEDVSIPEGNEGFLKAQVDVVLDRPSSLPITIEYTTLSETAVAFNDFQPTSGTLVIPGDSSTTQTTINIPILTDTYFEEDEVFMVKLVDASSDVPIKLHPGKSIASVKILNDDEYSPGGELGFDIEGEFSGNGSGSYTSWRPVNIGRFGNELIRVEGGTVSYGRDSMHIRGGTVYSLIGNLDKALFTGDADISLTTGVGEVTDTQNYSDWSIAGVNPKVNGIFLGKGEIRLSADLGFSSGFGSEDFALKAAENPTSSDALRITQDDFFVGANLLPSSEEFKLADVLPMSAVGFQVTYDKGQDALKLQGSVDISPFSKSLGDASLKADFTDSKYIQIKGGSVDVYGDISLENLQFGKNWAVDEAKLSINTVDKKVGGDFGITLPFGGKDLSAKLGAEFIYDPQFSLNKISGEIPLRPGISLGKIPLKVTSLIGGVNNISPYVSDPIEFSGGIGIEDITGLGLEIQGVVTISSEKLAGDVDVVLIEENVLKGDFQTEINWAEAFFSLNGEVRALNGFLSGGTALKTGSFGGSFGLTSGGYISVNVPEAVDYIGGESIASVDYYLSYIDNGNHGDDFAAAWTSVDLWLAEITVGAKINFNDWDIDLIGSAPARPINSFEITNDVDGTNRDWVLMGAEWANSDSDVQVRIQKHDGTWIEEADFAAHQIAVVDEFSNENRRTVAIINPMAGLWDIEVVDATGLGAVEYIASLSNIKPTIDIVTPAITTLGGEVNIDFEAYDADSDAKITFFYDTNGEGHDGYLLAHDVLETDGTGTYIWNTEGMATGDYFIYAMIQDDVNAPIFSDYAQGNVRIVESANLAVETSISDTLVRPGEEVTYTITVSNTAGDTARDVTLVNAIPAGATLVNASVDFTPQAEGAGYEAALGDIAFGETKTIELTIQTPNQIGSIRNVASVVTNTYDPEAFDDTSVFASQVDTFRAAPVLVDLAVVASTDVPLPMPGEDFVLTFDVFNNGQTDATGVTLVGNLSEGLSDFVPSIGNVDANHVLSADLGDLAAGSFKSITVQAMAPADRYQSLFNVLDLTANEEDVDVIDNLIVQDLSFDNVVPTTADQTVTLDENSFYSFSNSDFAFIDSDRLDTLQSIRITELPIAGQFFLDDGNDRLDEGEAISLSQELSPDDTANLKYAPAADANGPHYDSLKFQVSDGMDYSAEATIKVNVNATLPAIEWNTTNPSGETVANLFSSPFNDPAPNSTLSGIVVVGNTANPQTQGHWEYSTNGGSQWQPLSTTLLSSQTGRFLPDTAQLRFRPVANFLGQPGSLTVHLVDDAAILAQGEWGIDVSQTSGIPPYSQSPVTLSTQVAIDTAGQTVLSTNVQQQLVVESQGQSEIVTFNSNPVTTTLFPGWDALAAEVRDGNNQLLWKNISRNEVSLWTLDENWNYQSQQILDLDAAAVLDLETDLEVDVNGDTTIGLPPSVVLEQFGNVILERQGSRNLVVREDSLESSPLSVQYLGQPVTADQFPGWAALAAETRDDTNQMLWSNLSTSQVSLWTLDENWNYQSQQLLALESATALDLELEFKVDTNGDGMIGPRPPAPIEESGSVTLLQASDNTLLVATGTDDDNAVEVTFGGTPVSVGQFPDWQVLAADSVDGQNQMLWRNLSTSQVSLWTLDESWDYQSQDLLPLGAAAVFELEADFSVDANADGVIGLTIEDVGSVVLLQDNASALFANVGTDNIAITFGSNPATIDQFPGWQVLAADTVDGQNQMLWRNLSTNQASLWSLDENWNYQSQQLLNLETAALLELETDFDIDANGDNVIGPLPTSAIEDNGNVVLLNNTASQLFVNAEPDTDIAVTFSGNPVTADQFPGWQVLAADVLEGDNQIFWQNLSTNQATLWTLDDNWNYQSQQILDLDALETLELATEFGLTLVGNDDVLSGDAGDNYIDGGVGQDTLEGLGGDDVLIGGLNSDVLAGGAGNDTLSGGSGADQFSFSSPDDGVDVITDFAAADDQIQLSAAGFSGLTVSSALPAEAFHLGSSAATAAHRVIYDGSTGGLFFDPDGNGEGAQTQFATLTGNPSLTSSDIAIV